MSTTYTAFTLISGAIGVTCMYTAIAIDALRMHRYRQSYRTINAFATIGMLAAFTFAFLLYAALPQ